MEQSVTLRNGASVRVRAIRPDDGPRLMALCGGLSSRTLHQRFFSFRRLLPEEAHAFANVDYGQRMAVVAEVDDQFSADVLTDNRRALRLLARHTAITRRTVAGGVTSLVFSRRSDAVLEATKHGGS